MVDPLTDVEGLVTRLLTEPSPCDEANGLMRQAADLLRSLSSRAEEAEARAGRLETYALEIAQFYANNWVPNVDGDGSEPGLSRTWLEPTDALWDDTGRKATLFIDHIASLREKDAPARTALTQGQGDG